MLRDKLLYKLEDLIEEIINGEKDIGEKEINAIIDLYKEIAYSRNIWRTKLSGYLSKRLKRLAYNWSESEIDAVLAYIINELYGDTEAMYYYKHPERTFTVYDKVTATESYEDLDEIGGSTGDYEWYKSRYHSASENVKKKVGENFKSALRNVGKEKYVYDVYWRVKKRKIKAQSGYGKKYEHMEAKAEMDVEYEIVVKYSVSESEFINNQTYRAFVDYGLGLLEKIKRDINKYKSSGYGSYISSRTRKDLSLFLEILKLLEPGDY